MPRLSIVHGKLAWRVYGLFLGSALVPVVLLAVLCLGMVGRELDRAAEHRLHADARSFGMGIVERLLLVESELRLRAAAGSTRESADAGPTTFVARDPGPALIGDAAWARIARGAAALLRGPGGSVRLAVPAPGGAAVAELTAHGIWGDLDRRLDQGVDAVVVDETGAALFAWPDAARTAGLAAAWSADPQAGPRTWTRDGAAQRAVAWPFLLGTLGGQRWTVLLSRSQDEIGAPVRAFRRVVPLLVVVVLGTVALLAAYHIERRLEPIGRLIGGASRVASGDFGARLDLRSGDEFEALGHAFNDMAAKLGAHFEQLERVNRETLNALSRAVDAKSPWTAGHSQRVTVLAEILAEDLGVPLRERAVLERAGLVHDVGKIGTPAAILDKPGKLTAEEYEQMKRHPDTGWGILAPVSSLADVLPIVRHHHERYDGRGYPDGLAGEAIPFGARILAVADVFDALASDRPYRAALPPTKVIEMIVEGRGTQFDPRVVDALLRVSGASASPEPPAASEPAATPVAATPEPAATPAAKEDACVPA